MFTFTHFYFFNDTFSLTQGVFHLLSQGEYILFLLLFSFSLAMPLLKMLLLLYNINNSRVSHHIKTRRLNRLANIGKWSMLDVFVIAILAVTIKLSMIAEITIHIGLTLFALAVVLSMLLPVAISYLQPPLRTVTDGIERHNYLILQSDKLDQLLKSKNCIVEHQPNIAQAGDLLDIFNQDEVWQAKVLVKHVSIAQGRQCYDLRISLVENPSTEHQADSRAMLF